MIPRPTPCLTAVNMSDYGNLGNVDAVPESSSVNEMLERLAQLGTGPVNRLLPRSAGWVSAPPISCHELVDTPSPSPSELLPRPSSLLVPPTQLPHDSSPAYMARSQIPVCESLDFFRSGPRFSDNDPQTPPSKKGSLSISTNFKAHGTRRQLDLTERKSLIDVDEVLAATTEYKLKRSDTKQTQMPTGAEDDPVETSNIHIKINNRNLRSVEDFDRCATRFEPGSERNSSTFAPLTFERGELPSEAYSRKRTQSYSEILHQESCTSPILSASETSPSPSKSTQARKYPCYLCAKVFLCPSKLKRHVRIHTGEKPFKCYCGKSFTQKCSLKSHSKIHAKEVANMDLNPRLVEINGFSIDELLQPNGSAVGSSPPKSPRKLSFSSGANQDSGKVSPSRRLKARHSLPNVPLYQLDRKDDNGKRWDVETYNQQHTQPVLNPDLPGRARTNSLVVSRSQFHNPTDLHPVSLSFPFDRAQDVALDTMD